MRQWDLIQPSSSLYAASSSEAALPTALGSWLFDDFFHRKERKGDFDRERVPLPFGGVVVVELVVAEVGVRDVVVGLTDRVDVAAAAYAKTQRSQTQMDKSDKYINHLTFHTGTRTRHYTKRITHQRALQSQVLPNSYLTRTLNKDTVKTTLK